MQPNYHVLVEKIKIETKIVGFYDAPDSGLFDDVVTPDVGKWKCTYDFYYDWMSGKTSMFTPENFGCGGCGRSFFGIETQPREDFLEFLVGKEGLKDSKETMNEWIESSTPRGSIHNKLFVGPLKESAYEYLKSVTFFVNPDQLSMFIYGAHYHAKPNDPTPVVAPFGSGCAQFYTLFDNFDIPQAIIGATDVAMRDRVPRDIIAFTVTKPMFERLCSLDENSFLFKPFWKNVLAKRQKNQ